MATTYLRKDSLDLVSDDTAYDLTNRLPFAGCGISRKVFFLDSDTVLKVTTDPGGYAGDCSTEVAVWENACQDDRRYLAAVIAHGEGWIVQERVCCVGTFCEDCWNGTQDDWREAKYEMIDAVNAMGVDDMHEGNFGTVNGRVIAIDYAYTGGCGESCFDHDCEDCSNESCCVNCAAEECCGQHDNCFASSFCGPCRDTACEHGDCWENAEVRTIVRQNFFAHTLRGWVHVTNPAQFPAVPMLFCGKHAKSAQRRNSLLGEPSDGAALAAVQCRNLDAKAWERAGQLRILGQVTLVGRPTIDRMLGHCDIRHCCQDLSFYELCAVCIRRVNDRIARKVLAGNGKGN